MLLCKEQRLFLLQFVVPSNMFYPFLFLTGLFFLPSSSLFLLFFPINAAPPIIRIAEGPNRSLSSTGQVAESATSPTATGKIAKTGKTKQAKTAKSTQLTKSLQSLRSESAKSVLRSLAPPVVRRSVRDASLKSAQPAPSTQFPAPATKKPSTSFAAMTP